MYTRYHYISKGIRVHKLSPIKFIQGRYLKRVARGSNHSCMRHIVYVYQISSKYRKGYKLLRAQAFPFKVHSREKTPKRQQGGATIFASDTSSWPDIYVYQISSIYLKGYKSYWAHKLSHIKFYSKKNQTFCGFSMGRNQYWAGRVYDMCVYYMTGTPEGLTEIGFIEKPGIEPATPCLQGIALIHYTTEASIKFYSRE